MLNAFEFRKNSLSREEPQSHVILQRSKSALNSELQRSFSFGAMRIQLHTYIPILGTMNVEF